MPASLEMAAESAAGVPSRVYGRRSGVNIVNRHDIDPAYAARTDSMPRDDGISIGLFPRAQFYRQCVTIIIGSRPAKAFDFMAYGNAGLEQHPQSAADTAATISALASKICHAEGIARWLGQPP